MTHQWVKVVCAYISQDQAFFHPEGRVNTLSNMSRADVTPVEEPSQLTLQPISSSGKESQVTDPERSSIEDGGNPEFKLPKMGSLVVVLVTNVLMQVISRSCQLSGPC